MESALFRRCLAGLALLSLPLLSQAATGARSTAFDPEATGRVIVKWRAADPADSSLATLSARASRASQRAGMGVRAVRASHPGVDVLRLDRKLAGTELHALLARLQGDPRVEYAVPDRRVYAQAAAPDDTRYIAGSDAVGSWQGQWYLGSDFPASIDALGAWDTTTGSDRVTVAVIDTGVRYDHDDLGSCAPIVSNHCTGGGKFLPGYDFVDYDDVPCSSVNGTTCLYTNAANVADSTCSSTLDTSNGVTYCRDYLSAGDGDGRDADPSDPGDFLTAADLARTDGFFSGCGGGDNGDQPVTSSWHGTRVSGIIGALTNNGKGVAGIAPGVVILPVRALGKCGGYLSDVIDAMRWAAGLAVTGVPANPYPAAIINMSLGSSLPCTSAEQSAVDEILALNVLIVASAGNDGGPVNAPANCTGVMSVAGLRHNGMKVGYSSLSSAASSTAPAAAVSIAAPAGNCGDGYAAGSTCLYSIETTTNEGDTTPAAAFYTYALFNSGYTGNPLNVASIGTSFSAPMAAATAALMLDANYSLTPAQLIARMQAAAGAFPTVIDPATSQPYAVCTVRAGTTDSNGAFTDVPAVDAQLPCNCTLATCGAGLLNARAAVASAIKPTAVIKPSETRASLGDKVTLNGADSTAAAGHSIVRWQWGTDPGVSIADNGTSSAYFLFPGTRPVTVTLVVTDDVGGTATASTIIQGAVSSTDDHGTGAMGPELPVLALLAGLAAWQRRRGSQVPRAVRRR
ncbi:MAG TPA: S8 family serine peptidase [Steroidobacteraceae bacterium]|nr:S8 family serine peptidase [Steroidobacteraceae bacterium]